MKKLFSFLLFISVLFSLVGCTFEMSPLERIERAENLICCDLPQEDMEELYYHMNTDLRSGVSPQYCVYSLKEQPSCMDDATESLSENEADRLVQVLSHLNVPNEYLPTSYSPNVYMTGKENSYLIYYSYREILIVYIGGH